MKVQDLKEGMLVELEGDQYANACEDEECNAEFIWKYEYGVVSEVIQETPTCVVVEFEQATIGFPTDHEVEVVRS